ncbi:hypothetical protein C7212DRAFT_331875 [Tuber magnatum]|uniref:Uncharacterized protein n=1 Tax=Tuber magnatum TaxID=42249 RepID=A0A317SFZ3_9PEZI|nr:hypothetical protein C7212DRAFT_331875 [Tuber magnatum]
MIQTCTRHSTAPNPQPAHICKYTQYRKYYTHDRHHPPPSTVPGIGISIDTSPV